MKKPENVHEFDGYDFPDIKINPNPITKEEEDRLIAEMVERVKKRKALQDAEKVQQLKETKKSVSISVAAPNISFMENGR